MAAILPLRLGFIEKAGKREEPVRNCRRTHFAALQKMSTGMAERIRTFRDLEVWHASMDLAVAVYQLANGLPLEERFGLSAQMRRAVVSIPSNLAEGHAFRSQPRAYLRHVRIALGSFAELETQIELINRLRLLDENTLESVRAHIARTGQLLHGLLRALRSIETRENERSRL